MTTIPPGLTAGREIVTLVDFSVRYPRTVSFLYVFALAELLTMPGR